VKAARSPAAIRANTSCISFRFSAAAIANAPNDPVNPS
jgi:hypothetical protein